MATEYKDGTFGETLPFDEAMEEFLEAREEGIAKALHVGSYDEIEKEKAKKDFWRDVEKSIEELSDRVDNLEENNKDDGLIEKPSVSEMKQILKSWQK